MNFGPIKITDRLAFLLENLNLAEAASDPNAKWETFQFGFLNNNSMLGIDLKSRQVGWSWTAAAEAVAECILIPNHTAIFVSINISESAEKIRYCKHVIENLNPGVVPTWGHNAGSVTFLHPNGKTSRIISHPCKPPRGKAKATVYLDEFAHYPNAYEVFVGSFPVTTKGGKLRIGSSPLGLGGMFWEIYEQQHKLYPGYRRGFIPWWCVNALCTNVAEANKVAPSMTTLDRVKKYGTKRIITIYENMPLESFQQEYECDWVDSSVSFITWDEILANQKLMLNSPYWMTEDPGDIDWIIDDIHENIKLGKIEDIMFGGMDLGRKRNRTEIILTSNAYATDITPVRASISLDRMRFDDQRRIADKIIERLPIERFHIDQGGLGMQFAEEMEKEHPGTVKGVTFTNKLKAKWATETKVKLSRHQLPMPMDKDLGKQIHSIKKKVTSSGNVVYASDPNETHHADKFWALCLAGDAWSNAFGFQFDENQLQADYRG